MSYPTPSRYSLADSKDVMVTAINRLRRELNIQKPQGEAWLPSIQKRYLLSMITELELIAEAKAANDPRADQLAASHLRPFVTPPLDTEALDRARREAQANENRPRDPISDPPVTAEELAGSKERAIQKLLEQMKTASSAEKRSIRARLRRFGYRISDHTR